MSFTFLSGSIESTSGIGTSNGFILPSEVEPTLGNPTVDGSLLSSNTDGTRYWVSRNDIAIGVANNAFYLQGYTWASPSRIGYLAPNTATFTEVTAVGNINVANSGYVELNSVSHTTSKSFLSTDIMQKPVAEFPADVYRGGKIIIQVHKPSENITTISEFLLVHDDIVAYTTEYGIITTGNNAPLASFETNIVSGTVRFLATPSTSDDLQFKITETLFLA